MVWEGCEGSQMKMEAEQELKIQIGGGGVARKVDMLMKHARARGKQYKRLMK